MAACFFATDLHGRRSRYEALWAAARDEAPAAIFLGGDLLPAPPGTESDFLAEFLAPGFRALHEELAPAAPRVFLILGNDDPRACEAEIEALAAEGLWEYAHGRQLALGPHPVYGYACIPPSPFLLKDWERYDVSRYVDPGCVSPEEGYRSVSAEEGEVRWGTIQVDLAALAGEDDLAQAIFLFHSPPYGTVLDRAGLDDRLVDHAPVDVHVGSIAIRRFLEERQPLVALCGHVHEAARITGEWRTLVGRTHCLSAAHDGPELALVRFDADAPEGATRELIR